MKLNDEVYHRYLWWIPHTPWAGGYIYHIEGAYGMIKQNRTSPIGPDNCTFRIKLINWRVR